MGEGGGEPLQVGLGAGLDGEGEDFGDLVGVEFLKGGFEGRVGGAGGFDEAEDFIGRFDLILPTINRVDSGNEIDAGGHLPFDQSCANLSRLLGIGKGAEDQQDVGFHARIEH